MLDVIGVKTVEELISQVIPQSIRLKKPLALPEKGMSEYEFAAHIRQIASHNRIFRSFIGMGYYPAPCRPPWRATSSRTPPGTPPTRPTKPRSRRDGSKRCSTSRRR